jgi:thiamine-phosphate pyrophosphorylase
MIMPKVYPIFDSSAIPARLFGVERSAYLERLGGALADAGVTLLEYRNKPGTDAEVLADALALRAAMPVGRVWLILDDRVDVALAAGFDGVHVDAGDLPVAAARALLGLERIVGTSAGSEAELTAALKEPVDYVAFGPVFNTTTKQTSAAPIGVEGVTRFRKAAGPDALLVAAAGITLEMAGEILAAGASAVAVSAALFRAESGDAAAEFRRWMAELG